MPRFAANLSMMFNELPFLDRFDAAAQAGFAAVEYLFPYEHPPEAIADRLKRNNLTQALFNLPPGNWSAGCCSISARSEACTGLADCSIAAISAVDEKTIREYIESQKWDEDDQGFKIVAPTEP